MRKLFVTMWMTVDGYISGPKGEMDFVTKHFDKQMGRYEGGIADAVDTLVLGRKTYDSFASSWPKVPDNPKVSDDEKAYAHKLNSMKKVVFSKSLTKPEWHNSTVHTEIVPEVIEKLKAQPGKDIAIYGSASVVQQFTDLGLIDEYQLLVHPYVLGDGKRLFAGIAQPVQLKLVGSQQFSSGVMLLTYKRA